MSGFSRKPVAQNVDPPRDEHQAQCETTTIRTGQQCPHYGYFDPCEGEFRCVFHETRGIRDEAA